MNVIVFVMSIVMVVGILTYARIESYRSFTLLQAQFDTYMDKTEREALNSGNKKRYDDITASTKESESDKKEKSIKADKKLDFRVFVDKKHRQTKTPVMQQYVVLARGLMQFLYSDQQFFKEASEQKPDLIEQILQNIIRASEETEQGKEIKEIKEVANFDLKDPILNDVFYKMLKGTNPVKPKNGWKGFKPEKGYFSLLDYITLSSHNQIRVYLASPPILMSIFGNEDTVKDVIRVRENIYKRLDEDKNKVLNVSDLNQEFGVFMNLRKPGINPNILNFEVSKTDPKKYR